MHYRLSSVERAALVPHDSPVAEYLAARNAPTEPHDLTVWISMHAWQHHHHLDESAMRELSAMAYAGLEQ